MSKIKTMLLKSSAAALTIAALGIGPVYAQNDQNQTQNQNQNQNQPQVQNQQPGAVPQGAPTPGGVTKVAEPATILLMGIGIGSMALRKLRNRE